MASTVARPKSDPDFPCSLIIKTPFPTHRLASTALQALQVDAELSPLVRRKFSLLTPPTSPMPPNTHVHSPTATNQAELKAPPRTTTTPTGPSAETPTNNPAPPHPSAHPETHPCPTNQPAQPPPDATTGQTVLLTEYRAKTNRMLRVAVNGFMESLGVVLGVMERLDVDVLAKNRAAASSGDATTLAVPGNGTVAPAVSAG